MPTYLVHGFRWERSSIVIHIILQNLEDAAPEWIMAPATSISMLNSFYSLYDFLPPSNPPPAVYPPPLPPPPEKVVPEPRKENGGPRTLTKMNKGSMSSLRSLGRKNKPPNLGSKGTNGHKASTSSSEKDSKSGSTPSTQTFASEVKKEPRFNEWSVVKLLEQYDPDDLRTASQPFAYVADYMVEVKLGASLNEETLKYEADQKAEEAMVNKAPTTPRTPGTPGLNGNGNGGMFSPSLSVREARRRSRRLGWFEKLRDGLQKGADIGWFVVVCGDEDRVFPNKEPDISEEEDYDDDEEEMPVKTPRSAGLRGMFHKKSNIQEEH